MKLSLSSFVYFNYSLNDAIRNTAAAGYKGIDIWGGRPHAYRKDLSSQEIQELVHFINELDLEVASFIPAQFRYPTNLCCPIKKIREESIAYITESIETASALGAPLVSVCPGHTLNGQSHEDGLARLSDSLCAISEFAQKYRIQVAIEPADKYETDLVPNCISALKLAVQLGYENLGVLLDSGHVFIAEEPAAEIINSLGNKLFHVHLDDNNGHRDQHLIPGDGRFKFSPFFTALKKVKYSGFMGIELGWDYTVDPDLAVKISYERVSSLMRSSL